MDTESSGGGAGTLSGVAVACLAEKQSFNDDDQWLHRKYNMLRYFKDALFPSIEEMHLIQNARIAAQGAWSSVLRADELRSIMEAGNY